MGTETKEKMRSVNIKIPQILHRRLMIIAKTGDTKGTIRSVMIQACTEFADNLLEGIDLDTILQQIGERQYGDEGTDMPEGDSEIG